jgi:hypothetical protein
MILEFRHELEALINKHNMEATSDTAGFILCQYLMDCLNAFDRAVIARQKWYGHKDEAPTPDEPWPALEEAKRAIQEHGKK